MSRLVDIAADMERDAGRRGVAIRDLARGLRLQLQERDGIRTLTLSRPVGVPADREIAICRQAFGVPADAERYDGPWRIELRWPTAETLARVREPPAPEIVQPALFADGEVGA